MNNQTAIFNKIDNLLKNYDLSVCESLNLDIMEHCILIQRSRYDSFNVFLLPLNGSASLNFYNLTRGDITAKGGLFYSNPLAKALYL